MLRAVVAVLLLANALLLAWQQGWLGPSFAQATQGQREPERLQRQVNPEQLQVLAPVAASAAMATAAQRAADAASASPMSDAAGGANTAPPAPALGATAATAASAASAGGRANSGANSSANTNASTIASTCLQAGPFAAAELPAAEKALRAASMPAGSWASLPALRKGRFVVYMGPYADAGTQEKKWDELKRLKVDAQAVTPAAGLSAELRIGLLLASFDDKPAAEAELARMVQRGVRTGRVVTVRAPVTLTTLRVAAPTPEQQRLLLATKPLPNAPGFVACGRETQPG